MDGATVRYYNISLRVKDGQIKALPYRIEALRVLVPAESFIEACEKAEVYYSGALGVSMVTESGYEYDDYEHPDETKKEDDD